MRMKSVMQARSSELLHDESYVEVVAGRKYKELPQLMAMEDGTAIATPEAFAKRREELLSLFADTIYGSIPTVGFDTVFEVIEKGETLAGSAVRKQIKITISNKNGSSDALMLLVLPKNDTPSPVVFGLSFSPVHTALSDLSILPSYADRNYPNVKERERGTQVDAWCITEAIQHGYGIGLVFCDDFMPDNAKTFGSRIVSLFDKTPLKGISAWSFGIERMVDYLQIDENVDNNRLAVVGTSRLGKAALWAGANDERIALTISNVSGTCGAAMSRNNRKEKIARLNTKFPWWMNETFKTYNKCESELPVDQHELIACVAPRKIYISSAKFDPFNDSQGTWNALMLSRDAFRLYGKEVIEYSTGKQPKVGERVFSDSMAYHIRTGMHGITPVDWSLYFDYMDQYLK